VLNYDIVGTSLKSYRSTFSRNSALNKGGAIFLDQTPFNLENVTFTDNEAKNGGAMYVTKQGTIDIFFTITFNLRNSCIFSYRKQYF